MNMPAGVEARDVAVVKDSSFEAEAWAQAFLERHGRRPRVLHIGNIAANAYNNAKMMITRGYDCDVLCADYYHMMGCPEWEDADFEGDIGDHFAPTWTNVDLRGFERPRWFVQGPLELCLRYLVACAAGRAWETDLLWQTLGVLNRTRIASWREELWTRVYRSRKLLRRIGGTLASPVRRARVIARLDELGRRWRELATSVGVDRRIFHAAAGHTLRVAVPLLRVCEAIVPSGRHKAGDAGSDGNATTALAQLLCDDFRARFPTRADQLTFEDVAAYTLDLVLWREALAAYDIVQGYATDPIYPMLAGLPYCAFEHGTLRELPFRDDAQGRMTAMAYARASHVFVTNSDCIDNARILAGERASPLPHPFDEDRAVQVIGADAMREELQRELDAQFLCFFPTRHDWVEGAGFADKANDRFFRALAMLRRDGIKVGVVCCEWGRNVAESRALLRELGLEDTVKWVAPMGVVRYERFVLASDFVADQFLLGAFGGVTFRALAAGRPVLTYLRAVEVARSFGTCPPVINCQTSNEIAAELRRVLGTPRELTRIGGEARAWIKRYHSGLDTVTRQLKEYARVIDANRRTG